MGNDIVIYEVRDENDVCRFVGGVRESGFKKIAANIRKGYVDPYGNSPFKQWLHSELAAKRKISVVKAMIFKEEDGIRVNRKDRASMNTLINNYVAMLPADIQKGLLNMKLGLRTTRFAEFIDVRNQVKQTAPSSLGDARMGKGIVYGIYHNGKLIYVGTTAYGKVHTLRTLMHPRHDTRIKRYLDALHANGRMHEAIFRKFIDYEEGGRMAAFRRVIYEMLTQEQRDALLNERIGGRNF